jgi:hypothetical protein
MTCVVGLTYEGKVFIGADSESTNDITRYSIAEPKVFCQNGFVVGYCGSFRFGQLLQYHLAVRDQLPSETDMQYMVMGFAEAVRVLLKEQGYAEVERNQESGGTALIGYRGQLYEMQSDYSVMRYRVPYNAIGSGYMVAMGALAVLPDTLSPCDRITKALEAAARHVGSVQPPFYVLEAS